jgi:hypothetical protein
MVYYVVLYVYTNIPYFHEPELIYISHLCYVGLFIV